MLCPTEEVFQRSTAELFDCGVANVMSKVTHMLVCMVLTPCSCLSSVCSGSFKIKFCLALPETGVTNFLQEGYYTHQFAENECFVS